METNNTMRVGPEPRLGIDIGRVIIAPGQGSEDTSFIGGSDAAALATEPCAGALPAIAQLSRRSAGRVWLVSKCGTRVQGRSLAWLAHWRFHETTGVPTGNVHFCKLRHEKRGICDALGITHFIDDRVDVLTHLVGLVPNLFLFGPRRPGEAIPEFTQWCPDWSTAVAAITARLSGLCA